MAVEEMIWSIIIFLKNLNCGLQEASIPIMMDKGPALMWKTNF